MTPDSTERLWARVALATGAILLILTIRYTDWGVIRDGGARLVPAVLAAVAVSGAWHALRTLTWSLCFPNTQVIGFRRLFRVRLAAEAVSYVTVRGVAGEPLKVLLLRGEADAAGATAAVALERLTYILFTTILIGLTAAFTLATVPLSPPAERVFVILAATGACAALAVGALARRRATRPEKATLRTAPSHRTIVAKTAAFVVDVRRRLDARASGNRRRLVALAALSAASFACMSLEVWMVFRVAGIPIALADAVAIETLTRVASFVTAFIPAGIGSLEASTLAAAAALGTPGGALLAVSRRLRGLIWAAVGFLVLPAAGSRTVRSGPEDDTSTQVVRVLLYIAEHPCVDLPPHTRVAGLPVAERVVRAALSAGCERVIVLARAARLSSLARLDPRVVVAGGTPEWLRQLARLPADSAVLAIGPGTVVGVSLLREAMERRGSVADLEDVVAGPDHPVSGLVRVRASVARDSERLATALCERVWDGATCPSGEAVSMGTAHLALRMPSVAAVAAAEVILRRSIFKATDATLARFNRRFSLPISLVLLRTPITANAMSVFVFVLGMLSAWLFSQGQYLPGVLGGTVSLAASILDGCDGEIARLKYQESALGCWLETIGDYSYYLAIFVGLTAGAVHQTGWAVFAPIGALGLGGTVVAFALLIFLRRTITRGRPETLHAVAKQRFKADPAWWSVLAWRLSFVATRAAMPYGILVLALVNLSPVVVVLSAVGANVYWIALVLKLRQLLGDERADARREQPGELLPTP